MNDKRFTFLCTQDERDQLQLLADYYHRSQSDTVRMLIRTAAQELQLSPNELISKPVHEKIDNIAD